MRVHEVALPAVAGNGYLRGLAEFELTLAMGRADIYPEIPVTAQD